MIKKRNKKEGGERLRKCNVSGVNLIEVHYMHEYKNEALCTFHATKILIFSNLYLCYIVNYI
jgi:hypothetical protein